MDDARTGGAVGRRDLDRPGGRDRLRSVPQEGTGAGDCVSVKTKTKKQKNKKAANRACAS